MEIMGVTPEFWKNKRILVTGHTGFKGSWMSLWLQSLGAKVVGYALPPPSKPSMFEVCSVAGDMISLEYDIRDLISIKTVLKQHQPEIVFHMAAQSLVRQSFMDPVETYSTNVIGTVNVLEAVRHASCVKAVVNITSDKCYENRETLEAYHENDAMGGYDPYSSSKGCAELVTTAYRRSFFSNPEEYVAIASARAGNVIGGGDWAKDRLIPDLIRAVMARRPVLIRNPLAIRPWQHVLEPISGYLSLAEKLFESATEFDEGWNFGPDEADEKPVQWLVERVTEIWGDGASWVHDGDDHPHEAHYLKLDCSKAKTRLGWEPKLSLLQALEMVVTWHKAHQLGTEMREFSLSQITEFQNQSVA